MAAAAPMRVGGRARATGVGPTERRSEGVPLRALLLLLLVWARLERGAPLGNIVSFDAA